MPKSTFGSGTIVPPAWFNAQQNLIFDGQDLDGHQAKLTDDALSDDSNQIKARFAALLDEFKAELQSGLYVKINAGTYKNGLQHVFHLPETVLPVADNASSFAYITNAGNVEVSTLQPPGMLLLAKISASGGGIVNIEDKRSRFQEAAASTPSSGDFSGLIATTQQVKQAILAANFGHYVPDFSSSENSISWTDGEAYLGGEQCAVPSGAHTFSALNSGEFYVFARRTATEAAIIAIDASEPALESEQLWWVVQVVTGTITDVYNAQKGFGV